MDDFDININIPRGKKSRELVPLGAMCDGDSNELVFEITVQQSSIDSLFVTIKTAQNLILQHELPKQCTKLGTSYWEWDGFNNNGIYDSSLLKQRPISVIFQAKKSSKQKTITKTVVAKPAKQKWIDVKVNKAKKSIDVTLRLNIKDGGTKGLGELPYDQLQTNPFYKNLSSRDPKKQQHLRYKSLASLQQLVFSGLKKYWNRNIVTDDGNTYSLNVDSVNTTKDAMNDVAIIYNTNSKWLSSNDTGPMKNPLSLFSNFGSQKIFYNIGWVKHEDEWCYEEPSEADREFSQVAAYEIGHEISEALNNSSFSYNFRKLSTAIVQRHALVNADSNYPLNNEIDVIKYYHDNSSENFHNHAIASEKDAESLLWLSRLRFNG